MTNQRAFGKFRFSDEQIDVAASLEIAEQIVLVSKDDTGGQFTKTLSECRLGY